MMIQLSCGRILFQLSSSDAFILPRGSYAKIPVTYPPASFVSARLLDRHNCPSASSFKSSFLAIVLPSARDIYKYSS